MSWITTPDGAHVWNMPPFHIQIRKGGSTYPSRWVATWNLPLGETTEEQAVCPLSASEDTAKNAALALAHQKAQQALGLLDGTYTPPRHGRPPKSGERRLPWAFSAHPAVLTLLRKIAKDQNYSLPDLLEQIASIGWAGHGGFVSGLKGAKKQIPTVLSPSSQNKIRNLAGESQIGDYLEAYLVVRGDLRYDNGS